MTGVCPDMSSISLSSVERSLRECSLSSTENDNLSLSDLNSHMSLPYHWEQCLDLKTGEIYYRNWRTGMEAKEDPRTTNDFYSEEDEDDDEDDDDDDDDDDSSYDDSEESSSECSPISYSRDHQIYEHDHHNIIHNIDNNSGVDNNKRGNVLVVAGCKNCFMYFMVPKQDSVCSKCCGQLLHFDQSENGSV